MVWYDYQSIMLCFGLSNMCFVHLRAYDVAAFLLSGTDACDFKHFEFVNCVVREVVCECVLSSMYFLPFAVTSCYI